MPAALEFTTLLDTYSLTLLHLLGANGGYYGRAVSAACNLFVHVIQHCLSLQRRDFLGRDIVYDRDSCATLQLVGCLCAHSHNAILVVVSSTS